MSPQRFRELLLCHNEQKWAQQRYLLAKSALVMRRKELVEAKTSGKPTESLEQMIWRLEKAMLAHYLKMSG